MKFTFTILSLFIVQQIIGQTARIYEITSNGQKGKLLKTEQYKDGQLTFIKQFDGNGQLKFTIKKTYNDQNLLVKQVKTFKQDHEYDLITEYYYDSENRKSGMLRGNNRTGQWYSERYSYNLQGDMDTIFYYQKNGDLTNIRVQTYLYDTQNQKTSMIRENIDLEMDEVTSQSTFSYFYKGNDFDQKTIEKDENGNIISTEKITFTKSNQTRSLEYQYQDFPIIKTVYSYRSDQKISKKIDLTEGNQTTTIYQYNSKGKLIKEQYKTNNGYGGEIYIY